MKRKNNRDKGDLTEGEMEYSYTSSSFKLCRVTILPEQNCTRHRRIIHTNGLDRGIEFSEKAHNFKQFCTERI